MIVRTFLNKINTIVEASNYNLGLNPIAELNYGGMLSRILLQFNMEEVIRMVTDGVFVDRTALKHILKLTNCGSITRTKDMGNELLQSDHSQLKERATSFDVILFLLPKHWDCGRGYDYGKDIMSFGDRATSSSGSNWKQAKNGDEWPEDGVYSTNTLGVEYLKFTNGEESAVVAKAHFDYGWENLEIDVTEVVNKIISGELENYGFGLSFSPLHEETNLQLTQYIGFFTNHTNTIFEPILETQYNKHIIDDRNNFYIGKDNKLFLYTNIEGEPENLDGLPICFVGESECVVEHVTKGVYCASVRVEREDVVNDTILTDKWSNLLYKGVLLEDVELEFTVYKDRHNFTGRNDVNFNKMLVPQVSGILSNEKIVKGDIRTLTVEFREPYTTTTKRDIKKSEYRLYVKDGEREIDIIDYQPIERTFLNYFFTINTNDLVPSKYFIDIRTYNGVEIKNHKVLNFEVVSNATNFRG